MATLASLIASLRTLVNDTATANRAFGETPQGTVDGANTLFRLQNQNVILNATYVTYDTTVRSQSASVFTVDLSTGYLTMVAAPVAGKTFWADYAYNIFTDADLTEFLNNGARMLTNGSSDPTTVQDGLVNALLEYAAYYYWLRRAAQYASRYNSSGGGGGVGEQVDVVTKNFRDMAMQAKRDGDNMVDRFYNRQGQKNVGAAASVAFGIDPMSPLR